MHRGSCLCGSITYRIEGDLGPVAFCHCSRCRKANGSAFLAAAQVAPEALNLHDRDGSLRSFESSPGVLRYFCGTCASPLYSRRQGTPDILRLRIGTLDTPLPVKPQMQIFYADKAGWYDCASDIPTHDQRPT
ncbi:GFA family protein [Stutzerimonas kirkiae]|uniref:GFA family protein n=1 Tax=Stutzerimonas kirkiae TaxID=2211392 RepID=UPI0010382E10|nr:GFA family protein [Stutzerimonas kirkiae]TBV10369.1 aldehyde-activating protein [Stutzerimonas kirkiae]